MALESFGADTAKIIDNAVRTCHDLILAKVEYSDYDPASINFHAGETGIWSVFPSYIDGKPGVEIRLGVG